MLAVLLLLLSLAWAIGKKLSPRAPYALRLVLFRRGSPVSSELHATFPSVCSRWNCQGRTAQTRLSRQGKPDSSSVSTQNGAIPGSISAAMCLPCLEQLLLRTPPHNGGPLTTCPHFETLQPHGVKFRSPGWLLIPGQARESGFCENFPRFPYSRPTYILSLSLLHHRHRLDWNVKGTESLLLLGNAWYEGIAQTAALVLYFL